MPAKVAHSIGQKIAHRVNAKPCFTSLICQNATGSWGMASCGIKAHAFPHTSFEEEKNRYRWEVVVPELVFAPEHSSSDTKSGHQFVE